MIFRSLIPAESADLSKIEFWWFLWILAILVNFSLHIFQSKKLKIAQSVFLGFKIVFYGEIHLYVSILTYTYIPKMDHMDAYFVLWKIDIFWIFDFRLISWVINKLKLLKNRQISILDKSAYMVDINDRQVLWGVFRLFWPESSILVEKSHFSPKNRNFWPQVSKTGIFPQHWIE